MREVNPECVQNKLGQGITLNLQQYPWVLANYAVAHTQLHKIPLFKQLNDC